MDSELGDTLDANVNVGDLINKDRGSDSSPGHRKPVPLGGGTLDRDRSARNLSDEQTESDPSKHQRSGQNISHNMIGAAQPMTPSSQLAGALGSGDRTPKEPPQKIPVQRLSS